MAADSRSPDEACTSISTSVTAPELSTHNDQLDSTHRRNKNNEIDRDYDEAWTSTTLVRRASGRGFVRGARIRDTSTIERCPLMDGIYEESCDMFTPSYKLSSERRNSVLFYANADMISIPNDFTGEGCHGLKDVSTHSAILRKNQLPKNALLHYLGKASVTPAETAKIDLSGPIAELTVKSSDLIRGKSFFVLFRILEGILVLEGSIKSKITANPSREPLLSKVKRNSSEKNATKKSSSAKLLRKQSSPSIRTSEVLDAHKKSVINLREADVDVEVFRPGNNDFIPTFSKRAANRRSGLCMDIFVCMGRRHRSSKYDHAVADVQIDANSSASKAPVRGNVVIDSFDLKRIVYCGTEYIEKNHSHLITWLYATKVDAPTGIECHAAACDDFHHAKALATSLGDSIRRSMKCR